jgi:hypothetical protein
VLATNARRSCRLCSTSDGEPATISAVAIKFPPRDGSRAADKLRVGS